MKYVELTQQEIWNAMRSNVQSNKKKYNRKRIKIKTQHEKNNVNFDGDATG